MIDALYTLGAIGAAVVMAYPFQTIAVCAVLVAYSSIRSAWGFYRG